ncbi:MAG: DUF1971 domain-containing protein [Acidimicrobiales bacterium]
MNQCAETEGEQGRQLPDGLVEDRATPHFDATSVPRALLAAHHTTTWAELVVLEGEVTLVEDDPPLRACVRSAERFVLVPHRRHRIELSADAVFYVQFHRFRDVD